MCSFSYIVYRTLIWLRRCYLLIKTQRSILEWYGSTIFLEHLSSSTDKSAKLHALRAHVPTCLAFLRAHVPTCFACLRALRAYVPTCLACLRAHVPGVLCVPTCSRDITKISFQWQLFVTFLLLFFVFFPWNKNVAHSCMSLTRWKPFSIC